MSRAAANAVAGIEATQRIDGNGTAYTFVLNHGVSPVDVPLPYPMRDLPTGLTRSVEIKLPDRGVAILVPAS